MKSKIKKRVDGNRKQKDFSALFLLFVIVLLILGVVIIYFNKDILFNNDEVIYPSEKDSVYTEVDVNSPNIKNLFNLVHNEQLTIDSVIYSNKKLNVSDMEEYYKFSLASNIYTGKAVRNIYAKENEITAYLDEEVVKDSYEQLFGIGTYKRLDVIPYSCTEMFFDTVHNRYVTTNQICGAVSPFSAYEKIIGAKKNSSELLITTAVVFAFQQSGTLCKDIECLNIIGNYSSTEYEDEYFHKYIDNNLDKVVEYTYRFNLNDDGFYYYQGFERTKE